MDSKEFRKVHFQLQGRIFYPKLLKPEFNKDKNKSQYSVMFSWPIGDPKQVAQMKKIEQHLAQAKAAFFKTIPVSNLQLPIKTWGKYVKKDGTPNSPFLQDCHWMNLASNESFAPIVIDSDKNAVLAEAELYSGRRAVVDFSFWEYANKNFGISANVYAVMLQDGGDRVATGGVNVDEAFKHFVSDTVDHGSSQVNDSESLI